MFNTLSSPIVSNLRSTLSTLKNQCNNIMKFNKFGEYHPVTSNLKPSSLNNAHFSSFTSYNNKNKLPKFVKIVEVGARDGLQNEKTFVPTDSKIHFINMLTNSGLKSIEATSFVSPKWVPQMKDNREVYTSIDKRKGVSYPVLVPNKRGLESAIEVGVKEIAVFMAASNTFSLKNTNRTIDESKEVYGDVIDMALKHNIKVRGYVSCVCKCPYEDDINPEIVAKVTQFLHERGCYEISLGDTTGGGNPESTKNMLHSVLNRVPSDKLAVHFHNTYGQALANILTSIEMGISVVDSSTAGLGGCPYAKGATGNVPTEDVLYMLEGMGIETGVDLNKIIDAGVYITSVLHKENNSLAARAILSKRDMNKEINNQYKGKVSTPNITNQKKDSSKDEKLCI